MPPSDYKDAVHHGHAAVAAAPLLLIRLRAYWSRLFNRGPNSVEGHRILDK